MVQMKKQKLKRFPTNVELYESIKNLYLKNKCWTWFSDKKINRNEIFYKQINYSKRQTFAILIISSPFF